MTNIAILVVVLTIALGLGEFVVRLLYKDTTGMMPRYHTTAQYGEFTLRRIRPNSTFVHTTVDGSWEFTTNRQGFRNYHDFDYAKPDGKIRVVSLGDSHTQGHECDQDYTYSAVIERHLKARGIDAEVFNTGVSGFSTSEALVLLEYELVKYAPDFVVLGFFANDFQDNLKAGLYALNDEGKLKLVKKKHIPGVKIQDFIYAVPGVQWLSENSYFYSLFFNSVWKFYKNKLTKAARKKIPDEMAVATKTRFTEHEITLAAALIKRMHAVATRMGAKLIVLDIPQVGGENRVKASVIKELVPAVVESSDYFVSVGVLMKYDASAHFHVPHVGRHIAEFTHTLIGVEVAEYIESSMDH